MVSASITYFRSYSKLLLLIALLPGLANAQALLGNEWINPKQIYFKLPISQKANYRITYADLARVKVPVQTLDPAAFQVFRRGTEQAIYVAGQADGRFDPTDFIEFTGEPNDGALDSLLYAEAGTRQPHPYYSLFSDTAVYFLTWRLDGLPGKRRLLPTDTSSSNFYQEQVIHLFTSDYPGYPAGIPGKAESSLYEEGEGYTGPALAPGRINEQPFMLADAFRAGPRPRLEVLLTGRTAGLHRIQIWAGQRSGKQQLIDSVSFTGYGNQSISVFLDWAMIGSDGQVLIATSAEGPETAQYSVAYIRVQYPRSGKPSVALRSAPTLQPVSFLSLEKRTPSYLIVSHEALMQPTDTTPNAVRAYAAYRASTAGGGFDTLIVRVSQLMDLFTYGERHPLAIRRFVQYMVQRGSPRFLLLLGRARSVPGVRQHPQQALLDLVPTYGFPGSDALLTAGLNGYPASVPSIPTGRINAGTPREVLHYLNKVREYEAAGSDIGWRKQFLHLSGGRTTQELPLFRGFIDQYRRLAEGVALGAEVQTIAKQTDAYLETLNVREPVNNGLGLLTFFGHSSLSISDLDIGLASDDVLGYRNKGHYPLLFVNGCAMGNFFFGAPTLATDWVLTPDRGAIAAIAHSHLGYIAPLHNLGLAFYSVITDSTQLGKSIGEWQQQTSWRALANSATPYDQANAQQMVLQGDPAIRIFPFTKPDYQLAPRQFWVKQTTQPDSILAGLVITNTGLFRPAPLLVRIRQWIDGHELDRFDTIRPTAPAFRDTLWLKLPLNDTNAKTMLLMATVNPEHRLIESDYSNNQVVFTINLHQPDSIKAVLPDRVPPFTEVTFDGQFIRDQAVVSSQPTLTIQIIDDNPLLIRQDTTGLDLYLQGPTAGQPFQRLTWLRPGLQTEILPGNLFRITYLMPLLAAGVYRLQMQATDVAGNRAAPYEISFRVVETNQLTELNVYPNPFSYYQTMDFTLTGSSRPNEAEWCITDLNGRVVRRVKQPVRIGLNQWVWDGRSDTGEWLPTGVYAYRLLLHTAGIDWPATEAAHKRQQGLLLLTR